MVDGTTVLVVGALCLLVGVALGLLVRRGRRPVLPPPTEPAPDLDPGTAAVLEVLRSAVVVVDTEGRVVRASGAAHAFGLVRDDRVVHGPVRRLLAEVSADGEIRDTEIELPRGPVGTGTVTLQVRVAPLGTSHQLLLADDRTEARRVEAIRRDFVVNVSHELKTPVGALSLLAETVEEAADDPEAVRRFARRIQTEATRLSALVHEILELSRLQVSDALGAAAPVDVGAVLAEAVDRARTPAVSRHIEIDVGPVPDAAVFGDHDLLVTAVRNLLDNAVAYSDEGTRVAVATTLRPAAGLLEIAVVDQGIGIPLEEQPRLFERFYRVDPARSRDTGGTGLGLSIVKHVAADHGGDVGVWSQPGRGSTFTIRLPLAGRHRTAPVPVEATEPAEAAEPAETTAPTATSVSAVASTPHRPAAPAEGADR
ncbi:cell wall metabolism sensor histidine kinase WalK [Actinotalea sp. K2]|uniref:sensor histidine kinase n=1 Tax=Actinotalea sp. K2 TaxID=2939438 RepID=UPI002016DEAF|nr:ATP-binding protein [Actinotalea sp. K2]MCL3861477.1 ATP-binding protein [Actinotalea sp. K2]